MLWQISSASYFLLSNWEVNEALVDHALLIFWSYESVHEDLGMDLNLTTNHGLIIKIWDLVHRFRDGLLPLYPVIQNQI
jgi:hypothetical protein